MVGGLIGVATVMALMSLLGSGTNLWFMRLLMFLTGAGMAYAFVPGQTATFATISSAGMGQASALSNALRQLGSALGVAVIGGVLSIVGQTSQSTTGAAVPPLAAYHAAFLAAALLALIAACIALGISDRDAAPTMRPQARQTAQEAVPEQPSLMEAGSTSSLRRETKESGGRPYG
jgi:MFS family permease